MRPKETCEEDLGEELEPGANHYRAFVGPPKDYDLIAAMTFGLLTALGLRQHHSLLDIGCGSLRVGRLLIPYLNQRRYTGLEPNRWLVDEGIAKECGREQIEIKQPSFLFAEDPYSLEPSARFDFALAQSIFSHAGLDLISTWLSVLGRQLEGDGVLVATFVETKIEAEIEEKEDDLDLHWVYPQCISYRRATIESLARNAGFNFRVLDWHHPRQTWALFARDGFPTEWLDEIPLSWNGSLESGRWR